MFGFCFYVIFSQTKIYIWKKSQKVQIIDLLLWLGFVWEMDLSANKIYSLRNSQNSSTY